METLVNTELGMPLGPDAEREELLGRALAGLDGAQREAFRARIGAALDERDSAADELRFLQDLDIFLSMAGPAFMYSRGIAETLRVGEEIFELAYAIRQAKERGAKA